MALSQVPALAIDKSPVLTRYLDSMAQVYFSTCIWEVIALYSLREYLVDAEALSASNIRIPALGIELTIIQGLKCTVHYGSPRLQEPHCPLRGSMAGNRQDKYGNETQIIL